jgi:hypothetical protein
MRRRRRIVQGADQLEEAAKAIRALPSDKVYRITVELYQPSRTLAQNARYFAILGDVARFTGDDIQSLHKWCAVNFLGAEEGDETLKPISTAEQTEEAFGVYLTQVEAWATTLLNAPSLSTER